MRGIRLTLAGLVAMSPLAWCLSAHALPPNFETHIVDPDPSWINSAQLTTFADYDLDGDLDWTSGNAWGESELYWYEYQGPSNWVRHVVGEAPHFTGCASPLDANGDGAPDIVAGPYLFINEDRGRAWSRHKIEISDDTCHDSEPADLDQDGRPDVLVFGEKDGLVWYEPGDDPRLPWVRHDVGGDAYRRAKWSGYLRSWFHAASSPKSVADIDGDGDLDIAAAHAWFENTDGAATSWTPHVHKLLGAHQGYGVSTRNYATDMDGDGDIDIVQAESDNFSGRMAWLENTDGKGNFKRHWIIRRGKGRDLHTLRLIDYDNDGDLDIFTCSGPYTITRPKKVFFIPKGDLEVTILENVPGDDGRPKEWIEHIIHEGDVCHDGEAADVDRDGDIDLLWKGWTTGPIIYHENKLIDLAEQEDAPAQTAE